MGNPGVSCIIVRIGGKGKENFRFHIYDLRFSIYDCVYRLIRGDGDRLRKSTLNLD